VVLIVLRHTESGEQLDYIHLPLKYDGAGGTTCPISESGRSGKCLNLLGLGIRLRKDFATGALGWTFGFDLCRQTAVTRTTPFLVFTQSGDPALGLGLCDGKLSVQKWSGSAWAVLAEAGDISGFNWYFAEIQVVRGSSTGSYEIHLTDRGQSPRTTQVLISATDQDTGAGAIDGFELDWDSSEESLLIDNLYVRDSNPAGAVGFAGPTRIEYCPPNKAGASTEWTPFPTAPNWENAAETPPDDDGTRNAALPGGDDLYGVSITLGASEDILAVVGCLLVRDGTPHKAISPLLKSGEAMDVGDPVSLPDMSYKWASVIYETDPANSGPWEESAVNAAQIGVRAV
jgi:hypothetical protein